MRQINAVTNAEQKPGAAMFRIVQCPRCRVLLQEPPPGNPYYQCGGCSTTLQAKHATKADLESTNMRFNPVDKTTSRSSKSDSSSGEISERVGDDLPYGVGGGGGPDGHPSWSPIRRESSTTTPLYARPRGGAAAAGHDHFRPSSENVSLSGQTMAGKEQGGGRGRFNANASAMALKHGQPSQQILDYMVSMNSPQVDMTLLASESALGADYISRRREPTRSAPSPQEPPQPSSPAYGSPDFNPPRHPQMPAPRINTTTTTTTSSASRLNGGRDESDAQVPVGGNSLSKGGGGPSSSEQQMQLSGVSSPEQQLLQRHQSGPSLDQLQRTHSGPSASEHPQSVLNSQGLKHGGAGESSSSSSSSGRTQKLKWQARSESPVESPKAVEVVTSSSSSSSARGGGKIEDREDRIASASSHEDRAKDTTSVEYVTERNWRELASRRRGGSIGSAAEQHQDIIQRTQSDGSEKNFNMYDNPAYAGPDYEASETSSTMDEGEGNEGGAAGGGSNMGRFSPPPPLQLPEIRGGVPRSQSRPKLPRPTGYSEDANPPPTSSKTPTELDSMDNAHPHSDKVNRINRRQHSWDAARMGAAAAAASSSNASNSPVPGPDSSSSGLRKSSSDDYVREIEHLHSRGSSDPGAVYLQPLQAQAQQQQGDAASSSSYQTHQQQQQQHNHMWFTRLKQQRSSSSMSSPKASPGAAPGAGAGGGGVNSPRPPIHLRSPGWSQSTAGSNLPPQMELNSLPPSQFNPSPTSRSMPDSVGVPGAQLPPKREGNYPPLPLPGQIPHVNCQHCNTLLAVPANLPPPKKSTQKLRCGACLKISTFSVPQLVDSSPAAVIPEVPYGPSLFASSPDGQMDAGYRTTSGRSLTSATSDDLRRSGRRFSDLSDKSLPMTRNNSIGSADLPSDEELADRVRGVKIDDRFSNPVISTCSGEPLMPSSYSDGVSPSNPDYRTRFSRASPGPLYPKRGSLEHSNSGGRHGQVEERSRFAGDNRGQNSRRHHEEGVVTSSDDEDSLHRNLPHVGSPGMDAHHRHTHSGSRSPPHHPHSPPMFEHNPSSSGHGHGPGDHSVTEQAHEQPRGFNKALKGIFSIKTSLRELTHKGRGASASTRNKVTVNGVTITDHVVKKAEEHAGHISPGNYWYDELAGFWGVAGGQCEGIIPPGIEEFHYPLSRDCAGGRTSILVNGRELHIRDLEILAKRGLSTIPGRTYRIDIDGRVLNEATGEECKGLGPLAPTVVQKRRGNGMYMQTR